MQLQHRMSRPAASASATDVAVVGGGIIGVSIGLALQRAHMSVTIYDGAGIGAGASYGNAGLISVDSCLPIAMPGMLAKVPGWLTDPLSPLAIDWRYLPHLTPWLWRFLRAGRRENAVRVGRAMRALHKDAHALYREHLGDATFNSLIRVSGQIHLLAPGENIGATAQRIWAENGIETKRLDGEEIRQMAPAVARHVDGGIFFPNNGQALSPQRLTETLFQTFQDAGGKLQRENVLKVEAGTGGRLRVITTRDDIVHSKVVVSAGAWSAKLLADLGLRLPLDTERGYHVMVEDPGIDLRLPLLDRAAGFGVTPMAGGLRIAGTVELAGMHRPPNLARADNMRRRAERLLPGLNTSKHKVWMGFRPSAPDGLPIIDTHPSMPNLHIATAHSHFGMTAAPMTACIVADMVLGRAPQVDMQPYRLNRF